MTDRSNKAYLLCCTIFCTLLILTNIVGSKIFSGPFGSYPLNASILIYPLTFLMTDIVSEVFGKKKSQFMIFLGFVTNLIVLVYIWAIVQLPAHAAWSTATSFGFSSATEWQHAFENVFAINPILILSSLTAYLISQYIDLFIFHALKKATNDRHLWFRNTFSTLISQAFDTFIVSFLVLYVALSLPGITVFQIILSMYFFKALIALIDTPFCYLSIFLIRLWIKNAPHEQSDFLLSKEVR